MKIRIKAPYASAQSSGIFGADGKELSIGQELEVENEPTGWVGRYDVISDGKKEGKTAVVNPAKPPKAQKDETSGISNEEPKTVTEVLAMGSNSDVQFMTFKAAATKLLGDKTPSTKAEIITALEELATQP
jgi:hypothetical protein